MPATPTRISIEIQKLVARLEDLTEELNRARKQEVKPKHLWLCGRRSGIEAMRILSRAMELVEIEGAYPLRAMFGLYHRHEFSESTPIAKRLNPDQLLGVWTFFTLPWLRKMRPSFFRDDAGAYDFPRIKTDKKGRALNRQGKPVKVKFERDKSGKIVSGGWIEKAASVIDNYDEADTMAHLRLQYQDWSDGCLALADILEGHVEPTGGLIPLTPSESRVHALILSLGPSKGLTGPKIIKKLASDGHSLEQSTLTRHIVPNLKRYYGLKNRKGVGYYYDPT